MTLDEEAAKVARPYFTGKLPKGDPLVEDIAAFGRRCAEAMREECAKESDRRGNHATAQAIRRVNIT